MIERAGGARRTDRSTLSERQSEHDAGADRTASKRPLRPGRQGPTRGGSTDDTPAPHSYTVACSTAVESDGARRVPTTAQPRPRLSAARSSRWERGGGDGSSGRTHLVAYDRTGGRYPPAQMAGDDVPGIFTRRDEAVMARHSPRPPHRLRVRPSFGVTSTSGGRLLGFVNEARHRLTSATPDRKAPSTGSQDHG